MSVEDNPSRSPYLLHIYRYMCVLIVWCAESLAVARFSLDQPAWRTACMRHVLYYIPGTPNSKNKRAQCVYNSPREDYKKQHARIYVCLVLYNTSKHFSPQKTWNILSVLWWYILPIYAECYRHAQSRPDPVSTTGMCREKTWTTHHLIMIDAKTQPQILQEYSRNFPLSCETLKGNICTLYSPPTTTTVPRHCTRFDNMS